VTRQPLGGLRLITSNAIQRTYHPKISDQSATGFVIDVDGRQYLITAKHFAGHLQGQNAIEVFHNNQWNVVSATTIGNAPDEIDITVLALTFPLAHPNLVLLPDMGGLIFGQEVYFLGFPFGLFGDVSSANNNFPLPFVKGGIASCFTKSPGGYDVVFLDAINNRGFSGGPVIFKEPGSTDFKVASVISGYRYNPEPVYQGDQQLPVSIRENTGLVISYPINYAVELIKQNPNGHLLLS
jgi:Trypsin-like peptidase domain